MASSNPMVKAAIELRNSTLSIKSTTMLYQDSKLINGSFYPKITDKSSNIPNIGVIIGSILSSIFALKTLTFLGKKFYDYCRGCNTYGWKNNRNTMTESLLEQVEDNSTATELSNVTVDIARSSQRVATTPL
ncbi:hypothetical protein [Candidatus Mesenet endosymbiont of Phosphuga atrata]|uniref:hypothetical protein n=1 Tax=Candidatus Mesenet endosymbiont of Phosphuga atrata TaxID=3066221 RepID=UPI0030D508FB